MITLFIKFKRQNYMTYYCFIYNIYAYLIIVKTTINP